MVATRRRPKKRGKTAFAAAALKSTRRERFAQKRGGGRAFAQVECLFNCLETWRRFRFAQLAGRSSNNSAQSCAAITSHANSGGGGGRGGSGRGPPLRRLIFLNSQISIRFYSIQFVSFASKFRVFSLRARAPRPLVSLLALLLLATLEVVELQSVVVFGGGGGGSHFSRCRERNSTRLPAAPPAAARRRLNSAATARAAAAAARRPTRAN